MSTVTQPRIPRALKRLEVNNKDPAYWQKLLKMPDEIFADHVKSVREIMRRRWPHPTQLDRKNKEHIKMVSAHLRSMVDKMSKYYLTTPADLDTDLVRHVAFAFFINEWEKELDAVAAAKSSRASHDAQTALSSSDHSTIRVPQISQPESLTRTINPVALPYEIARSIDSFPAIAEASNEIAQQAVSLQSKQPPNKHERLGNEFVIGEDMDQQSLSHKAYTDISNREDGLPQASSVSRIPTLVNKPTVPLYNILAQIEIAKKRNEERMD